jgi:hypothetical protein
MLGFRHAGMMRQIILDTGCVSDENHAPPTYDVRVFWGTTDISCESVGIILEVNINEH